MEENLSPAILDGEIVGIRFGLATREEICTTSISDCPISHASQLGNPFLGLPLEFGKCESCGTNEPDKCEGHFGYIQLPIPIYHPSHVSGLRQMLSLLCLKCLKMKNKLNIKNGGVAERLLSSCCDDTSQISIREVKTAAGAFYLELKLPFRSKLRDGFWNFLDRYGYHYGEGHNRILLPCEVMRIIKSIPDETRRKLSGKGYLPQDGYILQFLPVPPNCLSVPDISDGVSTMSSDPSIPLLKKVLEKVEIIKSSRSGEPNFESHVVEANELQSAVNKYLQARGTAKASCDTDTRFGINKESTDSSTKEWLEKMRTLFIRKGSGFSSRSVITGDPYKRVNEIGVPFEVAQRITFEERVNLHNVKYLQDLVDNKLCLTYRAGDSTYSLREGSKGHTFLRPGQVVRRRIMDGDIVFINRPPTTHKHSLQALSVYVHDDHTVKINPLICGPLSADFDGDCVHLFYPQSPAAKAEVLELFSVEKQLLSSHSGNLNLQLATDSLLSLKVLFEKFFLDKAAAQQLAMFGSFSLPWPALLKSHSFRPYWTALQILQTALPVCFDCSDTRYLISKSDILKIDFDRDVIQSVISEVVTNIFFEKGPKEVLEFFDSLQPLLMENLFVEGFSVDMKDFFMCKTDMQAMQKLIHDIPVLLSRLRSTYNEELQLDNHIRLVKEPVVNFILKSSALCNLIDLKSDSAVNKVVQQVGFLGQQLSDKGKFYSKNLVEDMAFLFRAKHPGITHYPSAEFGLVESCFFHGLDPYEEMAHSISTREVIVRSSKGLSEPGTLFKNMMAVLRDINICYDGTVRNACSNSVIQFEYGLRFGSEPQRFFPAGEPVGVLAATAMSNPAYKAVLDSTPSSNSSWELMKEILLCKVSFKNDINDRRIILYLNDCSCGRKYCQEKAACAVKNQLKKVSLKDTALQFMVEYKKQQRVSESLEIDAGLVGHVHLDKKLLRTSSISMQVVLQKCQETINLYRKNKKVGEYFKKVLLSVSTCCCSLQSSVNDCSDDMPCLMFFRQDTSDAQRERTSHILANVIYPVLLETVIKGDPRISSTNIIWACPEMTTWIRNPCKNLKGEWALEIVLEKSVVKRSGDAWRIVMDSCLSVFHLIDTRRSIPYSIKQVQDFLGVSCAFEQAVQRLSTSVAMVARGVLKDHLILLANSMTCSGNLVGFNSGGYKALSRSLNVQAPFTEATLFTPKKCFERAAEKCHKDSLSSIVGSCSWGKPVAVGTGSRFDVLWGAKEVNFNQVGGLDVYSFLHMVSSGSNEKESNTACLGMEIEDLMTEDEMAEWSPSPEHNSNFDKPVFEDCGEFLDCLDNQPAPSDWDKVSPSDHGSSRGLDWGSEKENDWSSWKANKADSRDDHSTKTQEAFSNSGGWDSMTTWVKKAKVKDRNATRGKPVSGDNTEIQDMFDNHPEKGASNNWSTMDESNEIPSSHGWGLPRTGGGGQSEGHQWGHTKESNELPSPHSWGSPSTEGGNQNEGHQWGHTKESNELPSPHGLGSPSTEGGNQSEGRQWGHTKESNELPSPHVWVSPSSEGGGQSEGRQWRHTKESNELPSPHGWGLPSAGGGNESEKHQWSQIKEPFKKNKSEGSWGLTPNSGGWKDKRSQHNKFSGVKNDDSSSVRLYTHTRQRLDMFTSEEKDVLLDIEQLMLSIRRIMHQSGYNDGDPLSVEDQSFVLDNVFNYHPDRAAKMGAGIDFVMVSRHSSFQDSRCFYIVSTDGCKQDFSYRKCLDNFIKGKYPDIAEQFIAKYFPKRSGGNKVQKRIPEEPGGATEE